MKIIYSNIKDLSDSEKFSLEKVIDRQSKKIEKITDNAKLKVHIRTAKKGDRKRYLINYMLETPNKIFTTQSKDTSEAADFDIVKAAHKEMENLFNEVKHFTKKEESNWKKYSIKSLFAKFKE